VCSAGPSTGKTKSFIDTVIYRAGDQVGAWSYALLSGLGLSGTGITLAAVPIGLGAGFG